ncbi:MAG: hypothetical protein PHX04_01085 [Bacilli bacterium]|nr:hypothetical protein [Bacilli bacterium]
MLTSKLTRVIDNAGCFSIKGKQFQIIDNDILPRAKINIYISHKIGIKVEYNQKWYKVICSDNIPSINSTLNFNKMCKEHEYLVKEYATLLCSADSKTVDPLLVSS